MSKKTIWILNQTAGKMDSGWGERHHYLSKTWIKNGYDVKIISGTFNHLFTQQPKTNAIGNTLEVVEDGLDFYWIKTPKYNGTGFSKFYSNLIYSIKVLFLSKKLLGSPDVIIMSSMPIFPIVSAYYLKKKHKAKKLIVEIRDLWPLTPMYLKNYSKSHPLIKVVGWFEKFAYKKSDFIVSLLPNAETYITSISNDNSKFQYIPNGIDEELIGNDRLDQEIVDKIPRNKFIIGYTGTIGMANAMEVFVETAILLKDNLGIHFIIVGDGFSKQNLIKKAGNIPNLTFINKIKKSKVQHMISYFDICYLSRYASPLYKHGVSYNKYFDYMLAKKPILESSLYIKDQVELSKCGLIVEPENPVKLKLAILGLLDKPKAELNQMGLLGYQYVKKYHDYPFLANQYIKLFK